MRFPADPARSLIREIEPFDRGFFTGMVGWCDGKGDGEWAVTIRCAEIAERTLRLFAGAGIVTGSLPESELAETAANSAPCCARWAWPTWRRRHERATTGLDAVA